MEAISLICPVLNEEKNISKFLDYILAQSYIPEVVFVDGGSTDRTVSIIQQYQKKSKKIKLIKLNERGTGKAINIGFQNSSGKYILHAGADFCFIGKNIFAKVLEIIQTNPSEKILTALLPLKPKFKSIIKNSFMYWDNRYDVFLNLPFIRRDIFPTYPEISYGEDKIAANKLKDYYKHAKKFVLEEEFLRFQEDFSIHSFIKRYLWYGRTFLPYLKLCADKKEYIRILLSVFGVFFPIFLLIPFFVGFFDSIKFLKIYPANLVFFPLFAVFASWLMGVGFLLGFFYKDLGH